MHPDPEPSSYGSGSGKSSGSLRIRLRIHNTALRNKKFAKLFKNNFVYFAILVRIDAESGFLDPDSKYGRYTTDPQHNRAGLKAKFYALQVTALVWFIISYVPGGQTGTSQ
jgi:hypothetical protein